MGICGGPEKEADSRAENALDEIEAGNLKRIDDLEKRRTYWIGVIKKKCEEEGIHFDMKMVEEKLLVDTKVVAPTAKRVSTFKAKKSSDKYVAFEQSFPFCKFDAFELFVIFMRARDRNIGGN